MDIFRVAHSFLQPLCALKHRHHTQQPPRWAWPPCWSCWWNWLRLPGHNWALVSYHIRSGRVFFSSNFCFADLKIIKGPAPHWKSTSSSWKIIPIYTHTIHVWYIYLHLVDCYGKCREIYHTWMVWVTYLSQFITMSPFIPKGGRVQGLPSFFKIALLPRPWEADHDFLQLGLPTTDHAPPFVQVRVHHHPDFI